MLLLHQLLGDGEQRNEEQPSNIPIMSMRGVIASPSLFEDDSLEKYLIPDRMQRPSLSLEPIKGIKHSFLEHRGLGVFEQ